MNDEDYVNPFETDAKEADDDDCPFEDFDDDDEDDPDWEEVADVYPQEMMDDDDNQETLYKSPVEDQPIASILKEALYKLKEKSPSDFETRLSTLSEQQKSLLNQVLQ